MQDRLRELKWGVIAPVGLLVAALLAVAWFDVRTGGDADPPALLGEAGTPVRSGYTAIPPTLVPTTPTPKARTTGGEVTGTPGERDARRRSDLLMLFQAFQTLHQRDGEYPSTGNNVQTLCVFKANDTGCKITEILGEDPPSDPLGDPANNGYFYQSDGKSIRIFAQLENDIPAEQVCDSDKAEIKARPNMICVTAEQ